MLIKPGHVKALNTISGQVASVPAKYLTHPVFGKHLVEVDEQQKPYKAGFYAPKTADEYIASRPKKEKPELPSESFDVEGDAAEDFGVVSS